MESNTIENQKNISKRPIMSILNNMQINDEEIFSIFQMDTVRNAIFRKQLWNPELKFTTKREDRNIKVTRIA
jgi:hypothetical protein